MQKFTIFTIIFSTIVLTIVAELVLQDYLQKIYPPAEALQASVTTQDDFEFFYPDTEKNEEEGAQESNEDTKTVLEILEDNRESAEEVEKTVETSGINEKEGAPSLEFTISTRVNQLLPVLDIENIKYAPGTPDGNLWGIIDISDLSIKESVLGFFEVEDVIGSFYELETKNPLISDAIFEELKSRFGEFKEIEIHQTDQFGEKSFYINHSVKVGEVFLVMKSDNYIYCFGYQKQYHEKFKSFFDILLP